jgi:DNA-binding FadR family transcriptional regulator
MANFRPINKTTVSKEIVEQILTMIKTKQIGPGDLLPSERKLCEEFSVGRGSVREAMKMLEGIGLIKNASKGRVVRSIEKENETKLLSTDRKIITAEVFETRKLIEGQLICLAVQRATAGDIARIKQCILDSNTMTMERVVATDMAFHRAVADSAHNSVISEIYHNATGLLFQHYQYFAQIFRAKDEGFIHAFAKDLFDDHSRIVEAMEMRDMEKAEQYIKMHLKHAEEKLDASLKESLPSVNE